MAESTDSGAQIQQIFKAASDHDNVALQKHLDQYAFPDCASVDILDPTTGRCPLHAAIASAASADGKSSEEKDASGAEQKAADTVRLLLENGAIWNQLDNNDETPGCVALRLQLDELYQFMVDAGVRAELLLNRLDGYLQLDDEGDEDTMETEAENDASEGTEPAPVNEKHKTVTAGIASDEDVNSASYLSSVLSFDTEKLLDDQNNGVMMEWERNIMKRSAEAIIDKPGLKILNIGAGMLIFDSIAQSLNDKPVEHHIVEAHPDVLANMKAQGWLEKPGVVVHAGKWQDVLPGLVADGDTFDAIYFDTFAESYADFKDFFSEQVIGLMNQDGKWSFFNGMGADRQISYDVYQKVVEMDLFESGFDVEWHDMDIPTLDKEWEGVKRKYWNIKSYRLPVCKFMD